MGAGQDAARTEERVMVAAASGGLAGVLASVVLWRKRAAAAIPRMLIGSTVTAGCYSVLREQAQGKQVYTPAQVGAVSGTLSGLVLAMFLGPAPTISLSLGSIGGICGAASEFARQSVLDWRRSQMLSRHGIDPDTLAATAHEAAVPQGPSAEVAPSSAATRHEQARDRATNSRKSTSAGRSEEAEGGDKNAAPKSLPTWLPIRTEESRRELTHKRGKLLLLQREVEELEREVAEQHKKLRDAGLPPHPTGASAD